MSLKKSYSADISARALVLADIATRLGRHRDESPFLLLPNEVAHVLSVESIELAIRPSPRNYSLPFIIIGNSSRYRLDDLIWFLVSYRRARVKPLS